MNCSLEDARLQRYRLSALQQCWGQRSFRILIVKDCHQQHPIAQDEVPPNSSLLCPLLSPEPLQLMLVCGSDTYFSDPTLTGHLRNSRPIHSFHVAVAVVGILLLERMQAVTLPLPDTFHVLWMEDWETSSQEHRTT